MSRIKLFSRPTKVSDINQDELYDLEEDNKEWRDKAERLQERRWKLIQDREVMSQFFRSNRSPRFRQSLS